jgi:hypothetical protein
MLRPATTLTLPALWLTSATNAENCTVSYTYLVPAQGNNRNFLIGQGTVLVHELLHATQLSDNAFVKTYGIALNDETSSAEISRWLQDECKN